MTAALPPRRPVPALPDDLDDGPMTQLLVDEDYLGEDQHDVGRRVADDRVELFVDLDAAHSLRDEFVRLAPRAIVLHDVGVDASLRLLGGLSGAAGARPQLLVLRRRGGGAPLASLPFVELHDEAQRAVRVYATDLNAGGQLRAELSTTLLSVARLGVLLVGALPPHALEARLAPLRVALHRGPWVNRALLLQPMAASVALAASARRLTAGTEVAIDTAPLAARPQDAWRHIGAAWSRLEAGMAASAEPVRQAPEPAAPPASRAEFPGAALAGRSEAAPGPDAAQPWSGPRAAPVDPGTPRWQAFVDRAALVDGLQACCVFELHGARPLASRAGLHAATRLAREGTALLAALRGLAVETGDAPLLMQIGQQQLLLGGLPQQPGVAALMLLAEGADMARARAMLRGG